MKALMCIKYLLSGCLWEPHQEPPYNEVVTRVFSTADLTLGSDCFMLLGETPDLLEPWVGSASESLRGAIQMFNYNYSTPIGQSTRPVMQGVRVQAFTQSVTL